jgi:hypothetical protein
MSTFEKKPDLESAICDIDDMAKVCLILVDILEKSEHGIAEMGARKQAVDYLAERREAVSFSVLHLNGMPAISKSNI